MAAPSSTTGITEDALKIAKSLYSTIRQTYDHAMVCCGQFVVTHECSFGYLRESALQSEEAIADVLCSMYGVTHFGAFRSASEALAFFNTAFEELKAVSGLDTAGKHMEGYFLEGPTDRLLRGVRHALSVNNDSRESVEELAQNVFAMAEELMQTMTLDSVEDRATIHAEAKRLEGGQFDSLESVARELSVTLNRRDPLAVALVALALAGWEPSLNCWEKNVANIIRGDRALRGEYRLPEQLDIQIHNDILVGVSLDRRDTFKTLDGSSLLKVETVHIGQDEKGRFVSTLEQPQERMVCPMWARYERTTVVDWETVNDFVSQTGPVRYEWTSIMNRLKALGRACVPMDGMDVGKAFLRMSDHIKSSSPGLYKIWEKTLSQRSFTALTSGAMTTSAARGAVLERLILSTATDGSTYYIGTKPLYLRLRDGTGRLFDEDGSQIFVDVQVERMEDGEAAAVGSKFFAILTRAMDGWVIKPGFYKATTKRKSVLRTRAPRIGFRRNHQIETEKQANRSWQQLCQSVFNRNA